MLITRSLTILTIWQISIVVAGVGPLPHNHHMTYTTMIRAAHKEKIEINERNDDHLAICPLSPLVQSSSGDENTGLWLAGGGGLITVLAESNIVNIGLLVYSFTTIWTYNMLILWYTDTSHITLPNNWQQIRYIFNIYFIVCMNIRIFCSLHFRNTHF